MLEALVILWHKGLTFERTDAMAAATRRQSDAEIIPYVQEPKSRHVVNMVT